jgi:hypothetical protein
VKVDAAVLDRITGVYQLAPGLVITIRRDGDRVFAQATEQIEAEILPESDYEYFYKGADTQISFTPVPSGKVQEFVLHQRGRDLPAKRIEGGQTK